MRFYGKAEPVADFVFDFFDLIALELDDFFTILANNVIVMWMFGVIGIVKLIVLPKIHLADQPALGQQRDIYVYVPPG